MVSEALLQFTAVTRQLCDFQVTVEDIRSIKLVLPHDSIYLTKNLPPLFTVSFRVAADDKLLNGEEMAKANTAIAEWMKSKEAANGDKCPLHPIKPIMGKTFEYNYSPREFKSAVLKVFDSVLNDFQEVPHVEKYVMDRVYFPTQRSIATVTADLDW
jgi:hypothetical protein